MRRTVDSIVNDSSADFSYLPYDSDVEIYFMLLINKNVFCNVSFYPS